MLIDGTDELAEIFALLGDPGRMRMLLRLASGSAPVGELATTAGLSASAASHALRLLRAHRIVRATRHGREMHYELADAHVAELLAVGQTHLEHARPDHSDDSPSPTR